ncbi:MAG TPA: UdgX family uracil-DNA binding protein [Thermoanaerobaculia bacterium]|nr:UdgX family uracil-DNA binding protein [Thermoanaerobaculia bacterium]
MSLRRTAGGTEDLGAGAPLPDHPTLQSLAAAEQVCTSCDLYRNATQAVPGSGPARASILMVGEQPGDQEDLAGLPFVGPAGKVLDEALAASGIDRQEIYLTNAVKHFKWEARGKRRIHKQPNLTEVHACLPWLEAELALVKPKMVVCLGAIAAQALMGPAFRVTRDRGRFFETRWATWLTATIHPSAVLRMPDDEKRREAFDNLVADLAQVAERLKG